VIANWLWMLAPVRFTGAVHLRRGVERILADRPPLPNQFYADFVDHLVATHQAQGLRGSALKLAVISRLGQDMLAIAALIDGERHPDFPETGPHMRLLRKHGLIE
jgi:hypothetical protein